MKVYCNYQMLSLCVSDAILAIDVRKLLVTLRHKKWPHNWHRAVETENLFDQIE